MNTKTMFATLVVLASMVIGTVSILGLASASASAAKSSASNGIEIADTNVHDNTGPVSPQDIRFHEGLCQAGISTSVLDSLGGCTILSPPGESEHRP